MHLSFSHAFLLMTSHPGPFIFIFFELEQAKTGNKLKDFKTALNDPAFVQGEAKLVALSEEVKAFAETFPTVGY
jgi:hypothetical protein